MSDAGNIVRFEGAELLSFEALHDAFANKLGFPDFYGRNMDAWIDCMTNLDDPGFSKTSVDNGTVLTVHIENFQIVIDQAHDVWKAISNVPHL